MKKNLFKTAERWNVYTLYINNLGFCNWDKRKLKFFFENFFKVKVIKINTLSLKKRILKKIIFSLKKHINTYAINEKY